MRAIAGAILVYAGMNHIVPSSETGVLPPLLAMILLIAGFIYLLFDALDPTVDLRTESKDSADTGEHG